MGMKKRPPRPKKAKKTGAERVRWNLTSLYKGMKDPEIEKDVARFERMAKRFRTSHKGKLKRTLGKALRDYAKLETLSGKVVIFLYLNFSTKLDNDFIKGRRAEIGNRFSAAWGEYLTFFELEVARMPKKDIQRLLKSDRTVKKHRPWVEQVRKDAPHLLSEEVESALTKRSPFGPGSWAGYFDEMEGRLRFPLGKKMLTLPEILHALDEERDPKKRAAILKTVNEGLAGEFAELSAMTLYQTAGKKKVEDRERGYPHPMAARNEGNMIPDKVVEAVHTAVHDVGSPLAKRLYRLKTRHLGLRKLNWSDRNAKMPFVDKTIIPWSEAKDIVLRAYGSFSPTLAFLVKQQFDRKRIDAPPGKGKASGAYNYSMIHPDGTPMSWTFLNYQGSNRDVQTLAHELGHGVHGLLAGEEQGPVMFRAPMAFAETASVFGEMTTFRYLNERLKQSGDDESRLALIMGKLDSMINTVVRQIGFSDFEQEVHKAGRRLSVPELNEIWMRTVRALYGEDGEVFRYRNMDHLWCYVGHFHRPFYVYAYAFGEMLTQLLYGLQDEMGERFEPRYLDLLRAGGTKDVVKLTKPFGLNPRDSRIWKKALKDGIGALLAEAEELSKKLYGIRLAA